MNFPPLIEATVLFIDFDASLHLQDFQLPPFTAKEANPKQNMETTGQETGFVSPDIHTCSVHKDRHQVIRCAAKCFSNLQATAAVCNGMTSRRGGMSGASSSNLGIASSFVALYGVWEDSCELVGLAPSVVGSSSSTHTPPPHLSADPQQTSIRSLRQGLDQYFPARADFSSNHYDHCVPYGTIVEILSSAKSKIVAHFASTFAAGDNNHRSQQHHEPSSGSFSSSASSNWLLALEEQIVVRGITISTRKHSCKPTIMETMLLKSMEKDEARLMKRVKINRQMASNTTPVEHNDKDGGKELSESQKTKEKDTDEDYEKIVYEKCCLVHGGVFLDSVILLGRSDRELEENEEKGKLVMASENNALGENDIITEEKSGNKNKEGKGQGGESASKMVLQHKQLLHALCCNSRSKLCSFSISTIASNLPSALMAASGREADDVKNISVLLQRNQKADGNIASYQTNHGALELGTVLASLVGYAHHFLNIHHSTGSFRHPFVRHRKDSRHRPHRQPISTSLSPKNKKVAGTSEGGEKERATNFEGEREKEELFFDSPFMVSLKLPKRLLLTKTLPVSMMTPMQIFEKLHHSCPTNKKEMQQANTGDDTTSSTHPNFHTQQNNVVVVPPVRSQTPPSHTSKLPTSGGESPSTSTTNPQSIEKGGLKEEEKEKEFLQRSHTEEPKAFTKNVVTENKISLDALFGTAPTATVAEKAKQNDVHTKATPEKKNIKSKEQSHKEKAIPHADEEGEEMKEREVEMTVSPPRGETSKREHAEIENDGESKKQQRLTQEEDTGKTATSSSASSNAKNTAKSSSIFDRGAEMLQTDNNINITTATVESEKIVMAKIVKSSSVGKEGKEKEGKSEEKNVVVTGQPVVAPPPTAQATPHSIEDLYGTENEFKALK